MCRFILIALFTFQLHFASAFAQDLYEANQAYQHDDYPLAAKLFLKLAKSGNDEAQRRIGDFYLNGMGITKNEDKAVYWFVKAASQGNKSAIWSLTNLIEKNIGIGPNASLVYSYLKNLHSYDGDWAAQQMAAMEKMGFDPRYAKTVSEPSDEILNKSVKSEKPETNRKKLDVTEANSETLRIRRGGDGHFSMSGTVNNIAVTFLIDTGATYVSISEAVANAANLHGGRGATMETANGSTNSRIISGVNVTLGRELQTTATVSVGLVNNNNKLALLGQSFLSQYEMNVSGDEMTLRKRK